MARRKVAGKVVRLQIVDRLEEERFQYLRRAKAEEVSGNTDEAKRLRFHAYELTRRIYRIQGKPLPI